MRNEKRVLKKVVGFFSRGIGGAEVESCGCGLVVGVAYSTTNTPYNKEYLITLEHNSCRKMNV